MARLRAIAELARPSLAHPGFQVRRLRTLTLVTSAEWRIFKEKKHGDNEHVFFRVGLAS
jgi:hypothetical protein